jgi:rod shape-determining protein MreD
MSSFQKSSFLKSIQLYIPSLILLFSVLNEFDLNYLNIEYFSFNFVHILIFYWTLKNPLHLSYGIIFISGLINDVVIGIPIGLSSFCYLIICIITAYLRNITLSPNFINDWITLLFTLLLVNSIEVIFLDLIFSISVNYTKYFVNIGFTFLFYPLLIVIFSKLEKNIRTRKND